MWITFFILVFIFSLIGIMSLFKLQQYQLKSEIQKQIQIQIKNALSEIVVDQKYSRQLMLTLSILF